MVDDLASARYEQIENSGRSGRLSAVELKRAITSYGRTLTPLPDRAWDLVDIYPSASNSRSWYLDLPLWTKEEGRSDLTLKVCLKESDTEISVEIEDIRVL